MESASRFITLVITISLWKDWSLFHWKVTIHIWSLLQVIISLFFRESISESEKHLEAHSLVPWGRRTIPSFHEATEKSVFHVLHRGWQRWLCSRVVSGKGPAGFSSFWKQGSDSFSYSCVVKDKDEFLSRRMSCSAVPSNNGRGRYNSSTFFKSRVSVNREITSLSAYLHPHTHSCAYLCIPPNVRVKKYGWWSGWRRIIYLAKLMEDRFRMKMWPTIKLTVIKISFPLASLNHS